MSRRGFTHSDLTPIKNFENARFNTLPGSSYRLPIPEHLDDIIPQIQKSRAYNDEQLLRSRGLSRELSGNVNWRQPRTSISENRNRRAERVLEDEMAIRHNFSKRNPDIETIRRRAQYRKHLDFHCLPEGQNYVLLTTFGPDEKRFDILTQQVGIQIWGVFATLEECEEHAQFIRETNPHAVFFNIHTVQLGARIDLPPPCDGATDTHHLNQEHESIMRHHLKKSIIEAEYVEDRKEETLDHVRQANEANKEFNQVLKRAIRDASVSGKTWDRLRDAGEANAVLSKIRRLKEGDQLKITACKESLEKQSKSVKAVAPNLVEAYIENIENNNTSLPKNFRVLYKRFTNEEGREIVARIIQVKKQKQ
jgi:hypothetical protein